MMAFDQASYAFMRRQGAYVEQQVNEQPLPDIQYPSLIPVDTSAPDWTKTILFTSETKYGLAEWHNGNSDDIPLAGTNVGQHESSVYLAAVGYGYGLEEIEQARLYGYPLDTRKAMAARRAAEEFIDNLVFNGDALKGIDGFMNHPAVTAQNVTTGNWIAGVTVEDQMLRDINELLIGTATGTNYTTCADTLLLPYEHMLLIQTVRLGDTPQTLYNFLMTNNAYTAKTGMPLTMRGVRGLETAGVGGTARMIAYSRDPMTMVMHMPMPHQFILGTYREDVLNWVVPGIFRLGGLDIRRPAAVRYGDGI